MKLNNPIFADLSTYSPEESIPFYEKVFGWKYYKEYDYYLAYLNDKEIVGLYETPNKFKQMRMPHFWMTYFQVENADQAVEKAREMGGIIEMEESISGYGKVALIRDPQGAGFTIYEGNSLQSTRTATIANTLIWNELHVSDVDKVIPFYEAIFEWKIKKNEEGISQIFNSKQEHIADILEIPNEFKGKYEYWVCSFGVDNLEVTKQVILANKGAIVIDEGNRILFTDNSEQAFFYAVQV